MYIILCFSVAQSAQGPFFAASSLLLATSDVASKKKIVKAHMHKSAKPQSYAA